MPPLPVQIGGARKARLSLEPNLSCDTGLAGLLSKLKLVRGAERLLQDTDEIVALNRRPSRASVPLAHMRPNGFSHLRGFAPCGWQSLLTLVESHSGTANFSSLPSPAGEGCDCKEV